MISRLIDAYGDGLLDKSEFEPRISAARERLAKLEEERRQRIGEATQEAELRLVIGQLEEFARRVSQGLQEPDWDTRREIVRALVKQVEVDEQEVRIVYRVSPSPFEGGPQQGRSQHCWGRDDPALRDHHWQRDHPYQPLPPQVGPMLMDNWSDLDPEDAQAIEDGAPGWVVSLKLDGVRALLHVEGGQVRITSRCVSEVTYRVGEFQDNLPHLATGFSGLEGTILDGELVFPGTFLDTGRTVARHPLQAATAILSTSPSRPAGFRPGRRPASGSTPSTS